MASIERTAYPILSKNISTYELEELYKITEEELSFIKSNTKNKSSLLSFSLLLKTFQHLGYFPKLKSIPETIIKHISYQLDLISETEVKLGGTTLYLYHQSIRSFLLIKQFNEEKIMELKKILYEVAETRDDPIDLINISIVYLKNNSVELPSYRTINDLAIKIRTEINNKIFSRIDSSIPEELKDTLDNLLLSNTDNERTLLNKIKSIPKKATLNHLKELFKQLEWLNSFNNINNYLSKLSSQKIFSFADEARVQDASEMKGYSKEKRYTLLMSLLYKTRIDTLDNLVEMFLKRMHSIHKKAKGKLEEIQKDNRVLIEELIDVFNDILTAYHDSDRGEEALTLSNQIIDSKGGINQLLDNCNVVNAYKNNNYLPLLWQCYYSHRSTLFKIIQSIKIKSTTEETTLIDALQFLIENQNKRSKYLDYNVDVDFVSDRWKKLILTKNNNEEELNRREFEVCIFSYIAEELKAGDLCVEGAGTFADYRKQLLTWEECELLLDDYCNDIAIPNNSIDFVYHLKALLTIKSNNADKHFPFNEQLIIDEKGIPKLKRIKKKKYESEDLNMAQIIYSRIPERNLIDILCNNQHWLNYTRHFSPLSGSDSKMKEKDKSYVLTTFTYGCNIGPVQMSRHIKYKNISAHMLSYINGKHITVDKLNKAITDILNAYNRFKLPNYWGNGTRSAADGTMIDIYEQNLLSEYHVRYGSYGGIAFHHVADNYVALFSHFIPCGVWEAVYIIDGLLKNKSDIKPNIIHGDTQTQSTTVFGLSYLLGIDLMPRIRNWKDLIFYKPDKNIKYNHIDELFTDTIDWKLIETHWKDIIRVVLSIKEGKISSSLILRKLGNYSRKNKLYKAFRELGRVIRTIFLLDYISDIKLRDIIHATTNKVESYNGFSELLRFGGFGVIRTNDPVEQEKRIKYNDLIANAVMLQNVFDMTNVVNGLIDEGYNITPECLSILSPYITNSIKRFGEYNIDLSIKPPPLYQKGDLNTEAIK